MKKNCLLFWKMGVSFIGVVFIFVVKLWAVDPLILISSATYNGLANGGDWAYGVAVDGDGNILVTGWSLFRVGKGDYFTEDYFTVKYNNDLSVVLASATYNGGPAGGWDRAHGIVIDGEGNIIVTGVSFTGESSDDYFTIKYNSELSLILASATYNGSANDSDTAYGIVIDGEGNIIVTGESNSGTNFDYFTIKYNSELSLILASATYNGPANGWDCAYGVAVDRNGNIIVTGRSFNGQSRDDYFTIKYNSDLSRMLASVTYNGPANNSDTAYGVAVDGDGNIIVTGNIDNGTNWDCFTVKYNSNLSLVLASATYNGPTDGWDRAYRVIVDGDGNIIVAGHSNEDYLTIKYNSDLSLILASATYNGLAKGNDWAYGVAVDGDGNIIVTGNNYNGANWDYFTIKYRGSIEQNKGNLGDIQKL